MVSDDLSYDVLKRESDRIRKLYDAEKNKTAELEKRVEEQEKQFTEQYQKLLQAETGLVSGEETLHSIEQEKIAALSRNLKREHKMRLAAEEAVYKLRDEYEAKLDKQMAERVKLLEEKDEIIASLKDEINSKDEEIDAERDKSGKYEARELDTILDVEGGVGGADFGLGLGEFNWVTETRDLIKVIHRFGSVKLDEAAETLGSDDETVRSYARILKEKNLIKVDDINAPNPTLRATRDLVERLNDIKMRMKRRGRIQ